MYERCIMLSLIMGYGIVERSFNSLHGHSLHHPSRVCVVGPCWAQCSLLSNCFYFACGFRFPIHYVDVRTKSGANNVPYWACSDEVTE